MRILNLIIFVTLLLHACNGGDAAPVEVVDMSQDFAKAEAAKKENLYDGFVKFYEGKIGEERSIEMKLINWGDGGLSGSYFFDEGDTEVDLEGDLEKDMKLEIDEFIDYEQTGSFVGHLVANHQMTGRWVSTDSSRSLDFNLKERVRPQEREDWEGVWYRNELYSPGTLVIGDSDEEGFYFALSVLNNGHSGVIDGRAQFDSLSAFFESNEYVQDEPCKLRFLKTNNNITIEQDGPNFSCGFGLRAYASGEYDEESINIKAKLDHGAEDAVFPTKVLHDRFEALVGEEAYEKIAFNFQVFDKTESTEDSVDPRITMVKGGVTGLNTSNEAIILYDEAQQSLWAATIDFRNVNINEAIVRYFTNVKEDQTRLPVAIEKWRERFEEYTVVFESSGRH